MKNKIRAWLVFLIFLNGYVSLSLELVVLRQLSFYVGSSAVITSIIMGTFLGFMSLGYWVGESPRIRNSRIKPILSVSFIIIATMAMLAASFTLITNYFTIFNTIGITSSVIQTFIFSGIFLSAGPFLFGLNTTLLSRMLHRYNTNYTGNIMAWDTIGSVLGSLATTLFLMPFLGVNYTVALVVVLSLLGAFIMRPRWYMAIIAAVIIVPTLYINSDEYLLRMHGIRVNNANSTITVQEFDAMRILYMNGLPMSVYAPEYNQFGPYISYINDVYLNTMPRDRVRKVLVLGAGGFTAGLNDTFHEYTYVDIEHTLQDVSEKYFLGRELTPNKKFVVQDASQYLKNTTEKYDVIILDVYSNSFQIPEGFITAEFMHRMRGRVADGGVAILNTIVHPAFADKYSRVFDNTVSSVFSHNVTRHIVTPINPWQEDGFTNVLYIWHNRENDGRIYTINKTPVIYDR